MLSILFILGRLFFGGYFIYSGLNHFLETGAMIAYAKSKNVIFPKVSVILSGLILFLGGLGILFWFHIGISLIMIIVFLLVVSFAMHNFWSDKDPATRLNNIINFGKNIALVGASLILLAMQASIHTI